MEEIDLTELTDDILYQKIEAVEYEMEKISTAYAQEVAEAGQKHKFKALNPRYKKIISKLAKKYSEYLVPLAEELTELEFEVERRKEVQKNNI